MIFFVYIYIYIYIYIHQERGGTWRKYCSSASRSSMYCCTWCSTCRDSGLARGFRLWVDESLARGFRLLVRKALARGFMLCVNPNVLLHVVLQLQW